jgi:hypothetical protein
VENEATILTENRLCSAPVAAIQAEKQKTSPGRGSRSSHGKTKINMEDLATGAETETMRQNQIASGQVLAKKNPIQGNKIE